jgi:uncharacterized protein
MRKDLASVEGTGAHWGLLPDPTFLQLIGEAGNREDPKNMLRTLLLHCANFGEIPAVRLLLDEQNVPVDSFDEETGLTALHIAVGRDHLKLAQYLVERGAAFLPDKQGRMPSTIAAECEVSDEMCDFIAEAEAKAEGV